MLAVGRELDEHPEAAGVDARGAGLALERADRRVAEQRDARRVGGRAGSSALISRSGWSATSSTNAAHGPSTTLPRISRPSDLRTRAPAPSVIRPSQTRPSSCRIARRCACASNDAVNCTSAPRRGTDRRRPCASAKKKSRSPSAPSGPSVIASGCCTRIPLTGVTLRRVTRYAFIGSPGHRPRPGEPGGRGRSVFDAQSDLVFRWSDDRYR